MAQTTRQGSHGRARGAEFDGKKIMTRVQGGAVGGVAACGSPPWEEPRRAESLCVAC